MAEYLYELQFNLPAHTQPSRSRSEAQIRVSIDSLLARGASACGGQSMASKRVPRGCGFLLQTRQKHVFA